ncbi:MAG: acylphosphatase [Candidatus Sumerlaeota bacterium]|nr:acylphosphatase [Candidatus Sumerlaeota bacterium]
MNHAPRATDLKALHAIVDGRVQGVGFRAFVHREARELGLNGWVRNLAGGSVETWAEGTEEQLAAFLEALHRGPALARVTSVHAAWKQPRGEAGGFRVTH